MRKLALVFFDLISRKLQWIYTNAENNKEIYNAEGQLVSIASQENRPTLLEYNLSVTNDGDDNPTTLDKVTDATGRSLLYHYETNNGMPRISSITTPDGEITYGYANNNLISVIYPDNTSKTYHYENTSYPHHLTGITDENSVRYATWSYDGTGKAASSEHGAGIEKVILTYNPDGSTTATGALGDTRTYHFTPQQGSLKVSSLSGDECRTCGNGMMKTRTYDANGFINGYTDWKGNQTSITNNTRGLPTQQTSAVGTPQERTTTTIWHNTINLPTSISEPKQKTDFTYNATGQLLTRTVTDLSTNETRTTTYVYHPAGTNGAGLIATVDSSRTDINDVTNYDYDAHDNLTTITNALGQTTQITSHDPSGRPLTIIDPNNVTTILSWDLRGRLLTVTTAGSTTSFNYDPVGQLIKATQADSSYLSYSYDNAHRLIAISDNANNKIEYVLDKMGNRTNTSIEDTTSNISYSQSAIFDKLSRLKESLGAQSQHQLLNYDLNHNPLNSTDALNRQSQNNYDALGHLIKSIDPDAKETRFEYDSQDNLNKVIDAKGLETTYTYNGFDEVISQTSPDTGTTTYTYDKAGNRSSMSDARGVTVNYRYDALNRLLKVDYADNNLDITYLYDQGNHGTGRLTSRQDASGNTSYHYDARGNLLTKNVQIQTESYITQYRYTTADRLTGVTYPDGLVVDYTQDSTGKTASITATIEGVAQTIVNNINYLPFGPIKTLTYGNGLVENRTQDQSYRLQHITVGNLLSTDYIYNTVDNLTAISHPQDTSNDQVIVYDLLDRIINERGGYGDRAYQYDAVGNRTQRVRTNNGIDGNGQSSTKTSTHHYSYAESAHQLLSINNKVVTYDAMGNTLSINNGKKTFSYSEAARLTHFSKENTLKAEYFYNGTGERVVKIRHKKDGTTRTFHYHYNLKGQLLAETKYDQLNRKRLSREYIWLGNQPVAQLKTRYKTNGQLKERTLSYIHTDHINSPVRATNQNQTVVWEWNHEAFGKGSPDKDPDADESKVQTSPKSLQ